MLENRVLRKKTLLRNFLSIVDGKAKKWILFSPFTKTTLDPQFG